MSKDEKAGDGENKASKGFLRSISDSIKPAKEQVIDVGDLAYKAIVDNDFAKDIPIVKWIATFNEVRDKYQYLKIKRNAETFVNHLSIGDQKALSDFVHEVGKDEIFSDEFCTIVTEIIINGARPLKSKILANLINAAANKQIDRGLFEMLSQVVEHASIPALRALASLFIETEGSGTAKHSPHESLIMSLGFGHRFGTHFRVVETGKALWTHGFHETQP